MKNIIVLLMIFMLSSCVIFVSCTSVKYISPEVSYDSIDTLKKRLPNCDPYLDIQYNSFTEDACLNYERCLQSQVNFYKYELEAIHVKINELDKVIIN